jgi:hypothetical protein
MLRGVAFEEIVISREELSIEVEGPESDVGESEDDKESG